ncbi:ribosome biogenesis GTPase Der [bacterium]|nr:MAG: ribosome biogenesis GTPase Der [bacterium]
MIPVVAIIGRTNVGKSTLFNRLIGGRRAIVDRSPNTTRDRNLGEVEWNGRRFLLVDTGGIIFHPRDELEQAVAHQTEEAIKEADVIIFLVDREPLPYDYEAASTVRRMGKPVLLVVNKIDNEKLEQGLEDFYSLGLGDFIPVSAASGRNTGDMLDILVSVLPDATEEEAESVPRVAVVGRPNVGKSTLINRLVGDRVLVTSCSPGTTRDSVDTIITLSGKQYIFSDTAGLSKRQKGIGYYASLRSIRAIHSSDIVVLLTEAEEPLTRYERKIASISLEKGKSFILAVNKWDTVEEKSERAAELIEFIRKDARFLNFVPVIFISALTGYNLGRLTEKIEEVLSAREIRLPTNQLNRMFEEIISHHPPGRVNGKAAKINYITQVRTAPPTFLLFSNIERLPQNYINYIENQLRERLDFTGTPIKILVRRK